MSSKLKEKRKDNPKDTHHKPSHLIYAKNIIPLHNMTRNQA